MRRAMAERDVAFKDAVNDALRRGLAGGSGSEYRITPRHLGKPLLPLEKALELAAAMEDEEIVRELDRRR